MSRCIDVRNLCVYSGVTFSRSRLVEINMTRKQATIAVRSGLNDDEQYG
ncbi:cystathionine beta-lyases/cystathionine gamma-synthase domain protein, partial [Yersinia pestis PY-66]